MNIGDKLTWAYRSLFIIMLLWLRFLDQHITAWGIWIVWAVVLYFIFRNPHKKEEPEAAHETSQG
jgi:Ca2+/Na+ antiporter